MLSHHREVGKDDGLGLAAAGHRKFSNGFVLTAASANWRPSVEVGSRVSSRVCQCFRDQRDHEEQQQTERGWLVHLAFGFFQTKVRP